MKLLRESEQQSQYLIDLWFHHKFKIQLLCSPFQEEPIAKSIEDMMRTQNFSTRPISRLDSIINELVNRSEKILSYQPLTNSDISNSINLTHDSCCFENQDSDTPILEYPLEKISYLEKNIEILQESAL